MLDLWKPRNKNLMEGYSYRFSCFNSMKEHNNLFQIKMRNII